jgi:uncharacterized repeat protein (TIGR03803 family)
MVPSSRPDLRDHSFSFKSTSAKQFPAVCLTTLLCFAPLFAANIAHAQIPDFIFSFGGQNGSIPVSVPVQGRDGNLYGVTAQGGQYGQGTVYSITPAGQQTVLHNFNTTDGSWPAGLILATDGNFYGSTYYGGNLGFGVLFKMSPAGTLTILHEFSGKDMGNPGPPIEASNGYFYGSTGNINGGNGHLYRLAPSGTVATFFNVGLGSLMQGSDGDLYDAVQGTSAILCGEIFKLSLSGSILSKYNLVSGCSPNAPLVEAENGHYYGTTFIGGTNSMGTVFELGGPVLYNFAGGTSDGESPNGMVQATDGVFYGLTSYGGAYQMGTFFKITTAGQYTHLYDLSASESAIWGMPGVMQHTNGMLYGVTGYGGSQQNGTVFSMDIGQGPFVAFVRRSGRVGSTAQILGQGLTGATGVTFNGIPASSFSVVSDTYVTAVIPTSATSGPVVVTTPGGTLTSNKYFLVTH